MDNQNNQENLKQSTYSGVSDPSKDNSAVKPETKKSKKTVIIRRPNDDFKRKYFDYYDDVKISDRQDW